MVTIKNLSESSWTLILMPYFGDSVGLYSLENMKYGFMIIDQCVLVGVAMSSITP